MGDIKTEVKDRAKAVLDRATDYSGSSSRKVAKGIVGGIIVLLLGTLGLELSNTDFDLGKLLSGEGLSGSRVMRDKEGNVVTSGGKFTDEYNCDDFTVQSESQKFFTNAGGPSADTNRLDGDKDGVACESLPKTDR